MRIKSNPSSNPSTTTLSACGERYLSEEDRLEESRYNIGKSGCLTSACFARHRPSTTSTISYTACPSKPQTRSTLLSPKSASTTRTLFPLEERLAARKAQTVVLPTPPLPPVKTIFLAIPAPRKRCCHPTIIRDLRAIFLSNLWKKSKFLQKSRTCPL